MVVDLGFISLGDAKHGVFNRNYMKTKERRVGIGASQAAIFKRKQFKIFNDPLKL